MSSINYNLQIPYEIALFIVESIPNVDKTHIYISNGPNPVLKKLVQGLILEVNKENSMPFALQTMYGHWVILDSQTNSCPSLFDSIKEVLHLEEIPITAQKTSFWAIRHWNDAPLRKPFLSEEEESISSEAAQQEINLFLNQHIKVKL